MDSTSCSEVRAHLAETLKRLEVREEPVYSSRRGAPAGVLTPVSQYQRLQGGPGGFGQALQAWRERRAAERAAKSNEDGVDPFADVRDRSPDGGRPGIDWQALLSAGPMAPSPKPAPSKERQRTGE
jgi:prevent-host-death family protein